MQRAEATAILGVSSLATAAEIQAAYRSKSRLLHPDRFAQSNPADYAAATAEQARVNTARDVLLDPAKAEPDSGSRTYSPAAMRAARPYFVAAERLQTRAAYLNRMATLVGLPSLVIFVLSLFAHGAFPPFVRTILIVSVFGSFIAAGRARSRQSMAMKKAAQGQAILDSHR